MKHAERMRRFAESDLYVVITEAYCGGRDPLGVLDAALAAGVSLIQLREKGLSASGYLDRARRFRERTHHAGALLIIDDRIDIALAAEADGVHLGQSDLPVQDARHMASELIIGASTHSPEQAQDAQDWGASYVNIGPIFHTETKGLTAPPLGPAAIPACATGLRIPFTCMGGIKPHNIGEVIAEGARHIAVVTAVTAEPDVRGAAEELRGQIRAGVA